MSNGCGAGLSFLCLSLSVVLQIELQKIERVNFQYFVLAVAPYAVEKITSTVPSFSSGRPRILVPEKLCSDGLAILQDKYDVDNRARPSPKDLVDIIPNHHALIVRSETNVNAAVLAAGKKLRVVARADVGVDNIDVAEILDGGLLTAAVNAPLIMPEEYRKLQPFVRLIEKMGGLYTQHFVSGRGGMIEGRKFELIYQGDLAGTTNTRPLFAALVKGLFSSISDSGGRDVNIVNASLTAKQKGIIISETHSGEVKNAMYASLVTLRSDGEDDEQVVSLDGEEKRAEGGNEALMILGVKGEIGGEVVKDLKKSESVLNINFDNFLRGFRKCTTTRMWRCGFSSSSEGQRDLLVGAGSVATTRGRLST
ncbi:allosteric substrate binding domain-containing protein [Colletotrichum navitas]|uniref:Allosteric substrate binding domain-containing protein n=1 Tax=Colletotrichum navitas TaxID=681940 RepID=A0AAD8V5B3_9PEZI|nr:allosteric substrate binding domain-containing protein [Colletotrichum navitas]KAK1590058.1 allosteric substrate binding domain-containing protein [Colletotrichum navitas]